MQLHRRKVSPVVPIVTQENLVMLPMKIATDAKQANSLCMAL
jgi:hypothetical protein